MGCSGAKRDCWYCGRKTNSCFCKAGETCDHCGASQRGLNGEEKAWVESWRKESIERQMVSAKANRARAGKLREKHPDWRVRLNEWRNKNGLGRRMA